ncbi:MAG: serine hydrolase [Phycisphaerales bacterium]
MPKTLTALLLTLLSLAPLARTQDHDHDHDHAGHDHGAPAAVRPVEAPGNVAIPETPAGEQLRWILDELASKDDVKAEGRFTEAFSAQAPPDRLRLVFSQLRSALGNVELMRVDEQSPHALVGVIRSGANQTTWRVIVGVEGADPHRIDSMLFQPAPEEAIKPLRSWEEVDKSVAAMGEMAALGVYRVTKDFALEPVHTLNDGQPLAIGSAFKFFVLEAVANEVREGRLEWSTPIEIRDEWKSLPSGVMQNLPRGTEKPLAEYARQMISISDNTATDHLLRTLGREKVEGVYLARVKDPARTLPFLTTRELFAAKLSEDGALLNRYADADVETRRAMLSEGGEIASAEPQLTLAEHWRIPQRVDAVEWFASPRDLAETIVALHKASKEEGLGEVWRALSINPGIPSLRTDWASVGFKGGSEPGVLNVTWLLERHAEKGGGWGVVAMTLNSTKQPLDERTAIGLAQRVIEFFGASWSDAH